MGESTAVKRVFLYARVSTEEQAIHGLSIEAQTAALKEWAKANGYKIVDTYIDAGISARKPATKRPELQRLLADAQAGKGDLIVFTKLDRWFRAIAEYYKVQEILEKSRVDWRTIHEDYDTSTAAGRLKINIMLSVAQDEADRTSERIKAVFEMKRNKMEPLTGQMPFGYIIQDKRIVKDPETEEAVTEFFRVFLASGSISAAQSYVSDHFGIDLAYLKAHRMLNNQAYSGKYFGADNMAPPYITQVEFEKIQSMRRRVVRKSAKNRVFLFSGLAICGECGRRMGTRRATSSSYQYYTCPAPYLQTRACSNRVCMNEKTIEAYILDALEGKMAEAKFQWEKDCAKRRTTNYKQEIAAVKGKIKRLKDLYINELISLEEYKADHSIFAARLDELIEKDKLVEPPDFSTLETLVSQEWIERYRELSKEDKREIWRSAVREIRVYPDRRIEFDLNL